MINADKTAYRVPADDRVCPYCHNDVWAAVGLRITDFSSQQETKATGYRCIRCGGTITNVLIVEE